MDDGIGFGQSKHNGEGIGISNVNKRIKIYYGKDYGVTYSNINGLTEALIIIPKDGGVNNDKNHNS
jgi:two-component system sensor histidine kinase YesM